MPKTNIFLDKQRYHKLRVLLNGTVGVSGMSKAEVAKHLNVSNRQVYDYLEAPEKMQLGKLLKMARFIGVPLEELRESIKYQ
jgi:transposase